MMPGMGQSPWPHLQPREKQGRAFFFQMMAQFRYFMLVQQKDAIFTHSSMVGCDGSSSRQKDKGKWSTPATPTSPIQTFPFPPSQFPPFPRTSTSMEESNTPRQSRP